MHIQLKDVQPKPLDTQVAHKATSNNYALSNALSYITWGLIWDHKKRKIEPVKHFKIREFERKKIPILEKIKFRGNTIDWDSKIERRESVK